MEYKFITHPYLKNFKCSADKCVSTCCYGWNVKVDDKTYKAYKTLCNSFGNYIVEHISESTKNIYMTKNYCPFLNQDQMCKIQKQYGHDMLCDVCKTYPRTKRYFTNTERNEMVLSCPEVVKLIKKANIFEVDVVKVDIKGKIKKQEQLKLKLYDYLFEKLKYIYNKKANLYKTLYVLLTFAYNSNKFFKQKLTDKNVEEFNTTFNQKYFNNLYKEYHSKKDYNFVKSSQLSLVKNIVDFNLSNKILKQFFKDYTIIKFDNINFKSLHNKTTKSLNKNFNIYNILFYIIVSESFNIIKDKNFVTYINCAIIYITLIQTLALACYLNDKQRFYNNALILISNLYRFVFHSPNVDVMFFKFNNYNFSNQQNIFKYLCSF